MWKSKTPGIPDEEFERTESVPITKEEVRAIQISKGRLSVCLLYTSPSPRDGLLSRMPSSA